jgi:hypothetical protein
MGRETVEDEVLEKMRCDLASLCFQISSVALYLCVKAGFRPDQPRVPAGLPGGGQWTDEGNPEQIQLISRRTRGGSGLVRIHGQLHAITPAQLAHLDISLMQMRAALRAVRAVDRGWKPTPQAYESVEGLIRSNEWNTREAQFRLFELRQTIVGPGPFASQLGRIQAPPIYRRPTAAEQRAINDLGARFACHWCGTKRSDTKSGNSIGDHRPSNSIGRPAWIYPHCWGCSQKQGRLLSHGKN